MFAGGFETIQRRKERRATPASVSSRGRKRENAARRVLNRKCSVYRYVARLACARPLSRTRARVSRIRLKRRRGLEGREHASVRAPRCYNLTLPVLARSPRVALDFFICTPVPARLPVSAFPFNEPIPARVSCIVLEEL